MNEGMAYDEGRNIERVSDDYNYYYFQYTGHAIENSTTPFWRSCQMVWVQRTTHGRKVEFY